MVGIKVGVGTNVGAVVGVGRAAGTRGWELLPNPEPVGPEAWEGRVVRLKADSACQGLRLLPLALIPLARRHRLSAMALYR